MATKLDRVPPLLRAFALLERIVAADGPVALQDLADEAALPKPTVYRMLAMLDAAGLATREPDGRRIAAGPRLVRFALDVQLLAAVRAPRHAILKRLADELGETVQPHDARRQRGRLPRSRRDGVAAAHDAAARVARAAALHGERQAPARAAARRRGAGASSRSCRCRASPSRRSPTRARSMPSSRAIRRDGARPTTRNTWPAWSASPCRSRRTGARSPPSRYTRRSRG